MRADVGADLDDGAPRADKMTLEIQFCLRPFSVSQKRSVDRIIAGDNQHEAVPCTPCDRRVKYGQCSYS
jgi:hypothetical protein